MVANEYNLQNSGNGVDQMEDTNWRSFVALVFLFIASFLKCICNVYEMNSWHTREGFSEANLKVFHFWTHFSFLSKYIFTNTHHHHNHTIDDDNCMCILYIPVCIGWFQHFDGFDVLNSLCDPFFSFYFFIIYNSNTIFVFIEMIFFFLFFFFFDFHSNFKENHTYAIYRKNCRVVSYWCCCEWILNTVFFFCWNRFHAINVFWK